MQKVLIDRLEDGLDDSLDPTTEFPVEYPQQDDALLLQCRLPKSQRTLLQESSPQKQSEEGENHIPMASITGIPEEFPRVKAIHLQSFSGPKILDDNTLARSNCTCQAPHSSWKRQNIDQLQKNLQIANEVENVEIVNMRWVDLRSCSLGNPSLGTVAHLFRRLLGTSHVRAPWGPSDEDDDPMPHRVAVLFSDAAPDNIHNVRVGDICPSWALYSISRLQIPNVWSPWNFSSTTASSSDPNDGFLRPTTLLIYKLLPPRPLLSLSPPPRIPIDQQSNLSQLPKGCLWETYFIYHEEDPEEAKKHNKPDAPARTLKTAQCRMVAPPYISCSEEYIEGLWKPLLEHWEEIRDEALRIPQWTAWPEKQHYSKAVSSSGDEESSDGHATWTVFPLCHCFPANVPGNKKWIEQTCAFVPKTIQLLKDHLGLVLRTALFSRLDPETTLETHTGWADLANHVIRCHLPLVVPSGGLCGTWVDGCVETHTEGRFLCFDDSKVHRAFNYSRQERIVLILDLARPDNLPLGTATGGHSEELDKFIAQMNI